MNISQNKLTIDVQLEQLIILTTNLLKDFIQQQDGCDCQSIFNCGAIPNIQLNYFIKRIHKFTHFSSQCLIIAIIYIDRYNCSCSSFSVNWLTVHRLILTCLLLATKFKDDEYYNNHAFELGGGVNITQLNLLEMQIFKTLNFNLFVTQQQYFQLFKQLYQTYN